MYDTSDIMEWVLANSLDAVVDKIHRLKVLLSQRREETVMLRTLIDFKINRKEMMLLLNLILDTLESDARGDAYHPYRLDYLECDYTCFDSLSNLDINTLQSAGKKLVKMIRENNEES